LPAAAPRLDEPVVLDEQQVAGLGRILVGRFEARSEADLGNHVTSLGTTFSRMRAKFGIEHPPWMKYGMMQVW
jgi:hypothetical protein